MHTLNSTAVNDLDRLGGRRTIIIYWKHTNERELLCHVLFRWMNCLAEFFKQPRWGGMQLAAQFLQDTVERKNGCLWLRAKILHEDDHKGCMQQQDSTMHRLGSATHNRQGPFSKRKDH